MPGPLPPTLVDHPTLIANGTMRWIELDSGLPVQAANTPAEVDVEPAPEGALDLGEELDVIGVLGEGGLNIVHRAVQRSLGREVALKRVRRDQDRAEVRELLLREARIAGALAHPGIVPVHDLRWTEDGEPIVVLERISGESWSALIHDPTLWRARVGPDEDWLSWHLRVLVRVCEVVHFAHTRGYLHRDLKPDNVMIGDLGEVMLVDWGLALALDERAVEGVPRADEGHKPAGTPAYMAPEMTTRGPLDRRTDVFQLGAILYELLVGRPPYWGTLDSALIDRIKRGEAPLPDDAPAWLGAIVGRAMSPAPELRYEDADALRRVLQHVLEHQGADALARAAEEQVGALLIELARPEPERTRVYLLWGQIRLGFRQALSAWPHHDGAAEGLETAARAVAELELRREDADAAALVLAELDPVPPALEERLAEVRARSAAREAEARALAAVGREYDTRHGARTRTVVMVSLGLTFGCLGLVPFLFGERFPFLVSYPVFIAASTLFIVVTGALTWWGRDSILGTTVNRGVVGSMVLIMVLQTAFDLGAWYRGLPALDSHAVHLLLWTCVAGMVSVIVDRRLVPTFLGCLAGFGVSVVWPGLTFLMVSVCSLGFVANAWVLWAHPDDPPGG